MKTELLQARVTEEEAAKVRKMAMQSGHTVSSLLRAVIAEMEIQPIPKVTVRENNDDAQ